MLNEYYAEVSFEDYSPVDASMNSSLEFGGDWHSIPINPWMLVISSLLSFIYPIFPFDKKLVPNPIIAIIFNFNKKTFFFFGYSSNSPCVSLLKHSNRIKGLLPRAREDIA